MICNSGGGGVPTNYPNWKRNRCSLKATIILGKCSTDKSLNQPSQQNGGQCLERFPPEKCFIQEMLRMYGNSILVNLLSVLHRDLFNFCCRLGKCSQKENFKQDFMVRKTTSYRLNLRTFSFDFLKSSLRISSCVTINTSPAHSLSPGGIISPRSYLAELQVTCENYEICVVVVIVSAMTSQFLMRSGLVIIDSIRTQSSSWSPHITPGPDSPGKVRNNPLSLSLLIALSPALTGLSCDCVVALSESFWFLPLLDVDSQRGCRILGIELNKYILSLEPSGEIW